MSYPRNAATPPRVAVGPVVQISDGAVQTSGVSIRVVPQGGSAAAGLGTTSYEDGIVLYAPTQAESNYEAFAIIAYKTGCIPASTTVVTSASSTAGYGGLDFSKIISTTATVNLSGTTVKTATDIETDTQDIQSRLPAALVSGRMDSSVGAYQSGLTPLQPTIAGRTLDVSVGGEAGIDWANIGSPTTSVNLSGTTISTSQIVASVTGNVGGNVVGSVGSISGVTFPSNFASLGINASGHISRVVLVDTTTTNTDMRGTDGAALATHWTSTRAGYLDGVLIAANYNQRTVSVTGSNHVAADIHELQPAVIQSTHFAASAIDANALAADAVAKVATAVRTNLATELGRIDATTSSRASQTSVDTLTGYVDTEVAAIKAKTDNLPANPAAVGDIPTTAAIADAVLDELLSGHTIPGSVGTALAAASSAGDPWATILPGSYPSGSAGAIIGAVLAAIDAVPTAAEIDAVLTAAHGSGSWVGAGSTSSGGDTSGLSSEIFAAASGPSEVQNGDQKVKARSIAELIEADKHLAAKTAAADPGSIFRRITPPGAR